MKIKKIIAVVIAVGVISAFSIAAFAVSALTPAEIISNLTGKTAAQVSELREQGKTYGTIASDAGKLDEFKDQMLEQKKAVLDQRVADGKLTQQQADTIYNNIKENQANCTGLGGTRMGRTGTAGFGQGNNASGLKSANCGGGCGGSNRGNGQMFGRS